jgi:hypothetical protein
MEPQFYAIQLYDYDDKVRKSGWDIRACFVFTHDWDEPWGTFDTRPITDKLIAWSDVVRNSPPLPDPSPPAEVETTPPPPVEPPLPGRGDGLRHIQVLVDGKVEFAKWM